MFKRLAAAVLAGLALVSLMFFTGTVTKSEELQLAIEQNQSLAQERRTNG